jgi:hypothetical protein
VFTITSLQYFSCLRPCSNKMRVMISPYVSGLLESTFPLIKKKHPYELDLLSLICIIHDVQSHIIFWWQEILTFMNRYNQLIGGQTHTVIGNHSGVSLS